MQHVRQGNRRLGGRPAGSLHPLRDVRRSLPLLPGHRQPGICARSGRSSCCAGPTSSASRCRGRLKLALGIEKPITDEDLQHWSKIVYEACTMCNKCAHGLPDGHPARPADPRGARRPVGGGRRSGRPDGGRQQAGRGRQPAGRHRRGVRPAHGMDRRRVGSRAADGRRRAPTRWSSSPPSRS